MNLPSKMFWRKPVGRVLKDYFFKLSFSDIHCYVSSFDRIYTLHQRIDFFLGGAISKEMTK